MITILTYTAIISGGILVLMMVLSLFAGLDLDFDLDMDLDADVDSDPGFGATKTVLTFLSISAGVMRIILLSDLNIWVAVAVGAVAGTLAVMLMSYIFKLLVNNEENVNWELNNAMYQEGKAYLRIPEGGEGIVHILVNGVNREIKAKSKNNEEIKTGQSVVVMGIDGDYAIVEPT